MDYINRKRYKKKCIQGEVNFPYGTHFDCNDSGMILYNNLPVCYNTSQDAFDYFVRNDDNNGTLRGELIEDILRITQPKDKNKKDKIWETIWNNDYIRNKFKNKDHDQVWLWNFDFYNAKIEDLKMILSKIKNV